MNAKKLSMKTNRIVVLIWGAVALPIVVLGQHNDPPDGKSIAGEWVIHFQAEGQTVSGKLHFEQDGDRLTGTVDTAHTGAGTIENGKWNDNKLAASLMFERHEKIAIDGALKADGTLAGEYHTEGRTDKWQAERATLGSNLTSSKQYAPYELLIGEWDVASEKGGPAMAVQRVRWGPNHSYIWYASAMLFDGREEPHLEGMLVWNALHKNLDMLFSMDLKTGRVQEQGTMSVEADGTIVRQITAVYGEGARAMGLPPVGPDGASSHFRETYKKIAPNKILTSAMRETEHGWVATFPGSDHLIMTRR